MDGQRARRLKCGSPIGRVLDEAGDMVQYTFFTLLIGYVTKVGSGWYVLGYALINVGCYSMEVHFLITKSLNITLDVIEFGPVELELFITLVFIAAGIFGNEGIANPIVDYLPSFASSFVSKTLTGGQCFQAFCFFMLFVAVAENLEKCTHKHGYSFVYYMLGPLIILLTAILGAHLELTSYLEYQVIYNVFFQMILNIQIYRLMICNMCNLPFSIFNFENLIGFVPIAVHLMYS